MDPVNGEKLDYGAISALAEEKIGDDDEYDDLYNDVNVGGAFCRCSSQRRKCLLLELANNVRVDNEGTYPSDGVQFPDQKTGLPASGAQKTGLSASGAPTQSVDASQRAKLPEMAHNSEAGHLGYQASVSVPQKTVDDQMMKPEQDVGESAPSMNPYIDNSKIVPQTPPNLMNSRANLNTNHRLDDEYMMRSHVGNGNTMLFVGELHWWTTDAELESVLSQYGKVKEVKFFDESDSGKSKGYYQVEFYDPSAAAACKEGMHGHVFNRRACVVAYANAQTIKQMGASYTNRTQNQSQSQLPGRNTTMMEQEEEMEQIILVEMEGGIMDEVGGEKEGMMGPSFDLAFMGRGGGYGGFSGHGYPWMLPPYPPVNSMGLPGVAPYVNPAFFGRGMAPNGMGMMGTSGMDAHHSGMWADNNMGGWGGEEHGRVRSTSASREKERNSERDFSSNPEKRAKRHREERDHERDRYDRDHKYREEKDRSRDYRHKVRDTGYEDDWDKGQSSRSHSKPRAVPEDDHRSRSRGVDYSKRRRMPFE
ncbi:hypothetical protein ACS0TY_009760 [Phlomoides rotata]